MTVDDLLTMLRKDMTREKLTRNTRGTAIAQYSCLEQRWRIIAGLGIDGHWYWMDDMCVDGQPCNKQKDWLPI